MNHDHDTIPTLDGPAGQSFRRPSTPPEVPSFAEPIGTRRLTITASTFDGSESMVLVDRPDFPVWADDDDSDEPEPDPGDVDPACVEAAARVRAAFAQSSQDAPSASDDERPDPVDESAPVTLTARACGHCGRDITKRRKGCLYCDGACRVAAHRDPARGDVVAKAERRARKGTPVVFAKEAGR